MIKEYMTILISFFGVLVCVVQAYFEFKKANTKISLQDKYYKKILLPFCKKYRKCNKFKCDKFIKAKMRKQMECIPPYVIKIMENEPEKLYEILIYDYVHMRKNDQTLKLNIENKFSKIVSIICYYALLIFGAIGMVLLICFVGELFLNVKFTIFEIIKYLLSITIALVLGILIPVIINKVMDNEDIYTLKNKSIDKHIANRKSWYEKNMVAQKFFI